MFSFFVLVFLIVHAVHVKIPTREICPGVNMPFELIGTGGRDASNKTVIREMVTNWLQLGARGIDTAADYKDQNVIAEVISDLGIARKELFITSKCGAGDGYSKTLASVKLSLEQLNTTYIDLMLIHFPGKNNIGAWKALEELYSNDQLRAIGVSNFNVKELQEILKIATVKPMVNQCKFNVLDHDDDLTNFCKNNNITFEAYSPLGRNSSSVLGNPTLKEIGETYNKTGPQIALRWIVQHDILLTVQADRNYAGEDMDIFDFELTQAEMDTLDNLQSIKRNI